MTRINESAVGGTSLQEVAIADDRKSFERVTLKLLQYCLADDWAGYDPYDALNSEIFQKSPFIKSKWARLILTQFMKRSPVNFRPILRVRKTRNPKGLALFLSTLVKLSRLRLVDNAVETNRVADLLMGLRTPGSPYSCWGYSFDWQTRTKLVRRGSPNIICTTFAGNALLDAYEEEGRAAYREAAWQAGKFILDQLYCSDGVESAWFNYTPLERSQIHNANLLGAALLCRVSELTGEEKFLRPALEAARFSASSQKENGSWYYGERDRPSQKWIDNFHTGFNLCALRNIGRFAHSNEFEGNLELGLHFYRENFFEADGAPKYFHDRTYPLDIHSASQSVITLVALQDLNPDNIDLAYRVLRWAMANMWDERGYFYYQKHRYWTNRISYLRWAQAWMLLALAVFLEGTFRNSAPEIVAPGCAGQR
jgi:hypothetical protein